MNTFTFKVGFEINNIITAVHCPLEGFIVSVDKTSEIKEVNERKELYVYAEDYMSSSTHYALSAQYVCSVSDLLKVLEPVGDEKDEMRYARAAKEFSKFIPYLADDDLTFEFMEVKDE